MWIRMEHIDLLFNISELNWVFNDSSSIEGFLQKTVVITARHMKADVCSIYLYESSTKTCTLKATHGLNSSKVNHVKLKLGEGITGLALKELRPICDNHGSKHPNYKYFSDLKEEKFDSFLAVPIVRGIEKVGVLVIQRKKGHDFTLEDITAMRAVSNQLANIIENARMLIGFQDRDTEEKESPPEPTLPKLVKGKSAATGFALGPLKVEMKSRALETVAARAQHTHHNEDAFMQTVTRTRKQLNERQQAVEERLSDVASLIFTAHLMLLEDDLFYGRIIRRIGEGLSAETAIVETAQHFISLFGSKDNQHMREKADDIRDLSVRLLENLTGNEETTSAYEGHIVLARDLLPSDLLILSSENVVGIILIAGGVTSHLSVLARSLGLPMILADEPHLLQLPDKTPLLLDAEIGNIYINPDNDIINTFEMRQRAYREGLNPTYEPLTITATKDNERIVILSNINLLSDITVANAMKSEGVGLYRTEFPFIIRSTFPTEEEQVVVYRKLVEGMAGKPITFRTLDIGGDKILSYYDHLTEQNPFLGLRSIRFALRNEDIFRQQIRAILRAGFGADLRIMFPMITSLEELQDARSIITSCIDELHDDTVVFNTSPQIGIMIEIPAVVEIIDDLARKVDFFSIGTNDFVQYMLAVDRTNEKVAPLYLPHHPAVLRALYRIVESARRHDKPVSVCGDMAHQSEYIPFLIGIGIRILSVDAIYIPQIQQCISSISTTEAQEYAEAVLQESSITEIAQLLGIPVG